MEFDEEQEWMTPVEYYYTLAETLSWGEESHAEIVAQYQSECALFGDAGPGQGLAVIESSKMLRDLRDRMARVKRVIANLGDA